MKWYSYVAIGILVIIALIMPGCGSSENATTTTTYEGQVIVITYYSAPFESISGGVSSSPPSEGNMFLLVNLKIENHGYTTFKVSHYHFSIEVDGQKYVDSFLFDLPDQLTSITLHDGDSIQGNLVFEVPEGTTDFEIFNKYASSYNIQWIKQ